MSRLLEQVFSHARSSPDRPAYAESATGRTLTYGQLAHAIMHRRVNAASGDVVMLRCGNTIEFVTWFLAILRHGANVLPVSTELAVAELRDLAARAVVQLIVANADTLTAMISQRRQDLSDESRSTVPLSAGDSAGHLLLASSGTTGEPKIVLRTAQSLDAVSANMVEAIGFTATDRVLACVPLSHSYGLEHGLLAPLWAGSTVHLVNGLDLPHVTRLLAEGATVLPAVPSMIELLANVSDTSVKVSALRVAYSAGGALPAAVYELFRERFGIRVGQLYGMTEIGSVTFSHPASPTFDSRSVGKPMRDVSIRVLDPMRSGQHLPAGEEGEIAVRAPSMFADYVAGEPATLVEGHFPTGDLGCFDTAGNLTITGRVKLLVDTGGIKVNPFEVEAVLSSHPQVAECVVVPVQQSATVARLKAVVVARDTAHPPDAEALRKHVRDRLAGYKVPRLIEFIDVLPRTSAGKVKRQGL
jgi:acyl-CoA synthetase (AMP-forming)/AMP-acid ligase II